MPGSEGAARRVGWKGGGTADTASLPMAALPWGRLAALGVNASLCSACLPGILCCALWYHLSAKHAGRGGITFANNFFCKRNME